MIDEEKLLEHTQADTMKELVQKIRYHEDEDTDPPAS